MPSFLHRNIRSGTWKADHGHYKLAFKREGDKLHSSVTYHPHGAARDRSPKRVSPDIAIHAPAGSDRESIMTRASKLHHSYVAEHHSGISSNPHYRHSHEERVERSMSMSNTTDFNDFFKSHGGKRVKKKSPAAEQMKASGAGNKARNNHPNGSNKEAARVTTVRGGKQGGVQRTLEKPHATPDMKSFAKAFPVMDDSNYRLAQYTLEDSATKDE